MPAYKFTALGNVRRVAIVGSRHITDYRSFCSTVRPLLRPSDVIVSGAAAGIDSLAARYARQNGHTLVEFPVEEPRIAELMAERSIDRNTAFAIAAHERNTSIVNVSDAMIAIMCDHSRGTPDGLRKMRTKLGIELRSTDTRILSYLWDCGK